MSYVQSEADRRARALLENPGLVKLLLNAAVFRGSLPKFWRILRDEEYLKLRLKGLNYDTAGAWVVAFNEVAQSVLRDARRQFDILLRDGRIFTIIERFDPLKCKWVFSSAFENFSNDTHWRMKFTRASKFSKDYRASLDHRTRQEVVKCTECSKAFKPNSCANSSPEK